MKTRQIFFASLLIVLITTWPANARTTKAERKAAREAAAALTARSTDSLLRTETFLFVPTHVLTNLPGMRSVVLNTYYEISIGRDSIVSSLPYYGSVERLMPDVARSPFEFISLDFNYRQTAPLIGRKYAVVNIQAKEQRTHRIFTLIFEIFPNATANLLIRESASQQLTFIGNILPRTQ